MSAKNLIVNKKLCLVSSQITFFGDQKKTPFKSKLTTHREEPALHICFCFFYGTLFCTFWELIIDTDSSTPHERAVLALVDTFGTF